MRFTCSELGKGATSDEGSISSELLMCGGGVRSILLLSIVARCLETIDVCIWCMQMLYVCISCASCGSSKCSVMRDLQFVNAGRGCKRRPYGRGILQSRSHNCLVGSHECIFLFTPSCCSAFMICRGLCACTELLWMCVMYVIFRS